ncbi:MAG TPA: thiamine-phosphate kinase [Terracidiphilus sp.]|nr:thiamine-phosphate kinase [Terracidiphilus sp.]
MPDDSRKSRNTPGAGELDILARIRRRVALVRSAELPLGIGDDCALIRPRPGEDLAVTTDLSIAGRHFRLDWHPPESVGHRTIARGLSDLAATGARPVAAFLSLGLPGELTRPGPRGSATAAKSWLDRFLDGFLGLARAHHTPLAGGDLAESPIAAADIILIGAVPRGRALLRSGAKPGDVIYVTGALGGAAAALARLAQIAKAAGESHTRPLKLPHKFAAQLAPHLYPQPRLPQGQWLVRRRLATAGMDISDGLSTDLAHICDESEVAAEIDASALPIGPGATLAQALNGGEDYELLFTATASTRMPRVIAGVPLTPIGRILPPRKRHPQAVLLTTDGPQPLEPRGWQHFA